MRRFYLVLGIAIVALGLFHTASTPRFFDELSSRALWFASAGLALVLLGAINLLNWAHGQTARGLPWTAMAANLVFAGFVTLSGFVGGAAVGEIAIMAVLMLAAALLSMAPPAIRPGA